MSDVEKPAFLGVEQSLKGRKWRLRSDDDRKALTIAQRLDVPEIVGRVLAGRDVPLDEAERYLKPTLKDLLPNPSTFKDMDAAASRIANAIENGENIAVFGDYDVDGATSSGLLKCFFDQIGVPLRIYIPDRMSEGYGLNTPALQTLKNEGADLVITVDCGIVSFDEADAAKELGLDLIIVDHHQAETRLPEAVAVVNPKRHDESQEYSYLAAVGVAFILLVAINRDLRDGGWYGERKAPDLISLLDLVALGTVCDVVPLVGLNRAFVAQGLKVMAQRRNPGLVALADVAGLDEAPGTYHLGYIMGPRVNAGGRVGKADYGPKLLSSQNREECAELARILDEYNLERKAIETSVTEEAQEIAEKQAEDDRILVVAGEGWHPGVIGIVASRLKEAFQRPAIVIGFDNGVGKGSGRSIAGVDLGAAIGAARHMDILQAGGGHAMAAGLTISEDKLDDFRNFLNDRLSSQVEEAVKTASLGLDGVVGVEGASLDLIDKLEMAGPYGAGNPEPRFVLGHAKIVKADIVGENHVRVILTGAGNRGRISGICFKSLETDLGEALLNHRGSSFHVAGYLRKNTWRGQSSAQILIEDAYRLS